MLCSNTAEPTSQSTNIARLVSTPRTYHLGGSTDEPRNASPVARDGWTLGIARRGSVWVQRAEEEEGFAGLWGLSHPAKLSIYNTAFLDLIIGLSHAAAVTDSIPLGTSVLLLLLRQTADVASYAPTLQHLAGRRVTPGVGAGNNAKEFDVSNFSMRERGPRLTEGTDALRELFEEEASFSGRFHDFEDVRIDPQWTIHRGSFQAGLLTSKTVRGTSGRLFWTAS
jgi:alkanesulfonate monooxygenase